MARFLVSFIVGLISFSAFAWDGSYSLLTSQSNDGIDHCASHAVITTQVSAKGVIEQLNFTPELEQTIVFKNDIEFKLGHDGFVGYNRFGGILTKSEATRIVTSTSLAAGMAFLPFHVSYGHRLSLSTDGLTLTFKGHDEKYGWGSRFSCVYQKD